MSYQAQIKYIIVIAFGMGILGCDKKDNTENATKKWLKKYNFRSKVTSDNDDNKWITIGQYHSSVQWINEGKNINGINMILDKLLKEQDSEVYLPKVAYALAFLGNEKNVPTLISACNTEDHVLRTSICVALGNIGSTRAIETLGDLIENDTNGSVRLNAVAALKKIGTSDSLPYLKKIVDEEDDEFIRNIAIKAINEIESQTNMLDNPTDDTDQSKKL